MFAISSIRRGKYLLGSVHNEDVRGEVTKTDEGRVEGYKDEGRGLQQLVIQHGGQSSLHGFCAQETATCDFLQFSLSSHPCHRHVVLYGGLLLEFEFE